MMCNRVRSVRRARGLSGAELARQVRMSESDLSKLERGIRYPYPDWRRRIAEALEASEVELFPSVGEAAHA